MMFSIDNVDKLPQFQPGAHLYETIKNICDYFNVNPKIQVFSGKPSNANRGVQYRDTITLIIDKNETDSSTLWVFLHELKHLLIEKNPKLYKRQLGTSDLTYEKIKQKGLSYRLDPIENICDNFATEFLGKDYGPDWYQTRLQQKKRTKKNVRSNKSRSVSNSKSKKQNYRNR